MKFEEEETPVIDQSTPEGAQPNPVLSLEQVLQQLQVEL